MYVYKTPDMLMHFLISGSVYQNTVLSTVGKTAEEVVEEIDRYLSGNQYSGEIINAVIDAMHLVYQ
jgi:hypothetical protein